MKVLTRDEIVGAGKVKVERVPIPGLEGEVCMRTLSVEEAFDFAAWHGQHNQDEAWPVKVMIRILALTLVHEDGKQMFDVNSDEDMAYLRSLDTHFVQHLANEAARICKLRSVDMQAATENLSDGQS